MEINEAPCKCNHLVNHCHPFYKRFHRLIDWSFLFWEWSCLGVNKAHVAVAGLCLGLTGVYIFMFRFQWENSQCCGYTVSASSLMLLSAAKMGLGNDGQHLDSSRVTSCRWERGSVEEWKQCWHSHIQHLPAPVVLKLANKVAMPSRRHCTSNLM